MSGGDQHLQIRAVGERAHAALMRCGGVLRQLPAFPDSPYMLAGGEIVWLGGERGTWHPRRVVLAKPGQTGLSSRMRVVVAGAQVWRAAALPRVAPAQMRAAAVIIRSNIAELGPPAGFGALLAGGELRFPLDRASGKVRALAAAVACDDAVAFETAALPLLGLGPGLTPSGDDLVGACLFACRLRGADAAWRATAGKLARAVGARSNAVSAALFGDLARGAAYAPLHALAAAATGDGPVLMAAAGALTAIGHSSGWDMLTGFMIGAAAADAIDWKAAPGAAFQSITEYSPVVSSCVLRPAQDVMP